MHTIEVNERLLYPEDGLLLGNGDFSVSVYQTKDRIIWRLGKGDVWDRRFDYATNPRPTDIEELGHGIAVERWRCGPYGFDPSRVKALAGTDNPERMKEICTSPPCLATPYPMPKPVGEFAMQLPSDLEGFSISQKLFIEEARIEITCRWEKGAELHLSCFIPPVPDVLAVEWSFKRWDTSLVHEERPWATWFSLYRWADTPIKEFAERYFGEYRHRAFRAMAADRATPLPPPVTRDIDGVNVIEQAFHPEPTFEEGFRYWLIPFASSGAIERAVSGEGREARIHVRPAGDATKGWVVVGIATSLSEGGLEKALHRLKSTMEKEPGKSISAWKEKNGKSAKAFWSKSSVQIAEPLLEKLWYETLHAQRSVFRGGTVPPGLFLPSTVNDYSHWHGDYHTNYNIQSPFYGVFTANHSEIAEAYFDAVDFLADIGRKIAHDYYHCRGTFIQIRGFPIKALDDLFGNGIIGRMAYMTGWIMATHWRYYLYTYDEGFLKERGYPLIRDCALFYTDFLQRGDDGLYHAFPSVGGEDGISGNADDCRDVDQVMAHARYSLQAAIEASEILGVDGDIREEWRERLKFLAPGRHEIKAEKRPLTPLEKWNAGCLEPEFTEETAMGGPVNVSEGLFSKPNFWMRWYAGQIPFGLTAKVRSGSYDADRDFEGYCRLINRWRHPNGLIWGMAINMYGHAGAWSEALGMAGPLDEMLLQSWNRVIHIFPNWPKKTNASFRNLAAQGSFLVSAAWEDGKVLSAEIVSEKGLCCRLFSPWPNGFTVRDSEGREVEVTAAPEGVFQFETVAGGRYSLVPEAEG
jgi:hypothetical protein